MIIFNVDLDNTLIYSYRRNIGKDKINVEIYDNRKISFMTKNTHLLLKKLKEKLLIVPTTTRDINQYKRIDLKVGDLKYALVCNGGILLTDNQIDEDWYKNSLYSIQISRNSLLKSIEILKKENIKDIRFIKELFVFTKVKNIDYIMKKLKDNLDSTVQILNNNEKLYILPINLSKKNAILRFKKYINENAKIISAGDSIFDIPMFDVADYSFAPQSLKDKCINKKDIIFLDEEIFSNHLLKYINEKII